MKKKIFFIVLLIVIVTVCYTIFSDSVVYTIKKDGVYEIEKGITKVIVKASDVVINDSEINELVIEVTNSKLSINDSVINTISIEDSQDLNLIIDDETLVELLEVNKTDNLSISGNVAMINMMTTDSNIYIEDGIIANLYSYGSNINVDIKTTVEICNYYIFDSSYVNNKINGEIKYLEIDSNSNNNEFLIVGTIKEIVSEGIDNSFIIETTGEVEMLKTIANITGSGLVNILTKISNEIEQGEIKANQTILSDVINERVEVLNNLASDLGIEASVITNFANETGFSSDKILEISESLTNSNYDIAKLLDLSVSSGVSNNQIKEIINYTDASSSLTITEVVGLFDKLGMEANDISDTLSITNDCGLSISDVFSIYSEVKQEDDISSDFLFDIKDDYNLSIAQAAKLGIYFSKYY